jgi:hypothetical protein
MTRPELVDDATKTALKAPELRDLLGMEPLEDEPTYQATADVPIPRLGLAGDFTIALWAEVPTDRAGVAGPLATKFDADHRVGFNLSAVSAAPGYNGPGDEVRISFGIDAGSEPEWTYRGRPAPTSNFSGSLVVYEGALHAASNDGATRGDWAHVYRLVGASEWEDLGQVGGGAAHGVGPLVVHRGSLFAATWNHDYTRVHQEGLAPCRVYRLLAPGQWEDCGQPGDSRRLFSMASYHGDLYVVGDDFTVHVYRGGRTWELVQRLSTFVHPMSVFDGRLVLATWENPPTVLAFDGVAWEDFGNPLGDPLRCSQIHALTLYRGALHAGHWPLGRVSRWNAVTARWEQCGRLGDSTEINAMAAFNGKLYAGALPRAEVFRYERDGKWTSLRRFREERGWRPILPGSMTRLPDVGARIRTMGRVTSLTEHEGLLFASVTSCTGSAQDAPMDERGSIYALKAGVVATSSQSLGPGWHHIAGVRQGREIRLFIDGHERAAARGDIAGSIANGAPLSIDRGGRGVHGLVVHGVVAMDHVSTTSEVARLLEETKPGAVITA